MTLPMPQSPMERYRRASESAAALNKVAIFEALTDAGLTAVTVAFDASGGDPVPAGLFARTGEKDRPLPEVNVTVHEPGLDGNGLCATEQKLAASLEWFSYHCLEQDNSGWDADRAISATCHFDVGARLVTVDVHVRHFSVLIYESEH